MIEEKIITLENPQSFFSEIYRRIRTNIEFASIDTKIKTFNVTSTIASETKTTTACNLAVMYANKFSKALIIDTDLRRPSVHRLFKIKNSEGLADCMLAFTNQNKELDNIKLNNYIQKVTHQSLTNPLYIMTAGTKISNPAEFLGSKTFKSLLENLKNHFDIIIVDSAPSGIIVDGLVVSSACDATLFVTEYNKVKTDQLKEVINALKHAGANVIGSLITKTPVNKSFLNRYYNSSYYYEEREDD